MLPYGKPLTGLLIYFIIFTTNLFHDLQSISHKGKELILKNAKKLKGKGIFLKEDFLVKTNKIRRDLIEKMKIARNSGKYAALAYDKLIVKELNRSIK